jgi:hypothetical protein
MERFEATWTRIIDSLTPYRQLWIATIEATGQVERAPQLRAFLADALEQACAGFAAMFGNVDALGDEKKAWKLGSFYYALMSGVMVQWLIDPEHAPSGHDLAEALQLILKHIQPDAIPVDKGKRPQSRAIRKKKPTSTRIAGTNSRNS